MKKTKVVISEITGTNNPGMVIYDDEVLARPGSMLNEYLNKLSAEGWEIISTNYDPTEKKIFVFLQK